MQSKLIGSLTLIALGMTLAVHADAQQIYKTVDKDGNVVFTDVPPRDGSDAVKLEKYNVYTPPTPTPSPAADDGRQNRAADTAEDESAEQQARYDRISIIAPAHDESIRQNAGTVNVSVGISPKLHTSAGHRVQILLDGEVVADGASTNVVLENVDRGTHQIAAQVANANGDILAQSAPSTFHLLRYSVLLAPPRPSPSR